ncbi:MAG: MobF family relaxase [Verrucomicrobiota bacterium]
MLSPKTQYDLENAESYFQEHLSIGDYYSNGNVVKGQWFGTGSVALGLKSEVEQAEFLALCRNLHPQLDGTLTQHHMGRRIEPDKHGQNVSVANRRVFYDFMISAPKSVSIAALVCGDLKILEAHNHAVSKAMAEMESFAATRVRKAGASTDRETGSLVGATFQHDTSRALDPHLHSHCIVFNATFDPVEQKWKALQNYEILRAQKFIENVYYHELARALIGLGYSIENNRRGDFAIKGVSRELCDRFSKRHAEINAQTHALLFEHPEKAMGNQADIRDYIAQNNRSRKIKGLGADKLREHWHTQITPLERTQLELIRTPPEKRSEPHDAEAALSWAEAHLFERRSVVNESDLWQHALEFARGSPIEIEDLKSLSAKRGYLRDDTKIHKLTTRDVLAREWEILQLAKDGVAKHPPLSPEYVPSEMLTPDQLPAVAQILGSNDFLTLFRGAAGTGKSFALKEVLRGLEKNGHKIEVLAPQRQQTIDLVNSGLTGAKTVSEFLARATISRGSIVLLDEAGQVGATQMLALLQFVRKQGGRIVCSGDTHQHGAVESSDALRAIEKYSGLKAAELTSIRRQNPDSASTPTERAFIEQYKQAVQEASAGMATESLNRLEKLGAIVECKPSTQQESLATHFVALAAQKESVLVVAQTWSEIHKLNEHIRDSLKQAGLIGSAETKVHSLQAIDLTEAQKRDPKCYEPDSVLIFNRATCGFRKSDRGRVLSITAKGLVVETANKVRIVPFSQLDRLTVCRERELSLSTGDRLQLKANSKTTDGRLLVNGELVTIARVRSDGCVELTDGRILDRTYRQFVPGYAVTSYASQGKTVDYVLFSDSAVRAATSKEQWYVTISRGRKGVRIFTSDTEALREAVERSGNRELALDLLGPPPKKVPTARNSLPRAQRLVDKICQHAARIASQIRATSIQRTQQNHD